jgi:hypothetical protein
VYQFVTCIDLVVTAIITIVVVVVGVYEGSCCGAGVVHDGEAEEKHDENVDIFVFGFS